MPRGRVIDPVGQQANGPTWGYIRRDNMSWPDKSGPKVIPFLNTDPEKFCEGADVEFDVYAETLSDPKLGPGSIGVATNVDTI